ncbi:D-amino-acid transaminase [Phytobacter sp. V91]|uniref:D-amino-acid transaminase n=1 Tax=Phytobacter sp. V91 TaxID=3369425 RepID=UPI003F62D61B
MSRTVYLNGEYVPEEAAKISVFDRGFLFADAVYEVTAVVNSKLVDFAGHYARLARSCHELGLTLTQSENELREIHQRLLVENALTEGGIYLQLTRGNSGDRDFHYPSAGTASTLVLFTQARPVVDHPAASKGIRVVTCPDIRWQRRDIKTVQLLAPCMAKAWAEANGADDAFLVEDGFITEGSACNCYIVLADKTIITRPLSNSILHGITRKALLRLGEEYGVTFEERLFTPEEARRASEVFISSATTFVWPVVSVDGQQIGDGKPGQITQLLRKIYLEMLG